jgi:glycerol-3-phosphate acyltransferase PlsX
VVKSHGGADALGYASAIRVAVDLARSDFSAEIERNLKRLTETSLKAGAEEEKAKPSTGGVSGAEGQGASE